MGRKAISFEKQNLVRQLLSVGANINTIISATKLSQRSIYRIRKEMQNEMNGICLEQTPKQNAAKTEQPQEKPTENAPEATRINVERQIETTCFRTDEVYVRYDSNSGDIKIGLVGNLGYFMIDTSDAPAKLRTIAAHLNAIADTIT